MNQLEQEIVSALREKGAVRPCPRCGTENFQFVGLFKHALQDQGAGFKIGGKSIPVAALTCVNCGWMSEHALGALGLLRHG